MSNTPRRKGATSSRKTARPRPTPAGPDEAPGRDWRKWALWALGGLTAVALILFIISDQPETVDLPDDPNIPEAVETFEVTDRSHVETAVVYDQDPPVGGAHNPTWLNCGFYEDPVPNENVVHALEHGVVWITYDAARTQAEELEVLRALAAEPEVIVSPYQGLGDTPVVASAWGAQLRLGSAIDARLPQFVDAYRDGAAAPEPAASCVGGVGEPE